MSSVRLERARRPDAGVRDDVAASLASKHGIAVLALLLAASAAPRTALAQEQPPTSTPSVTAVPGHAAEPPPRAAVPTELEPAPSSADQPRVHRAYRGLVIAGSVTFGVSWGFFTLEASICTTCRGREIAWIPVAGPLLVVAEYNRSATAGVWAFVGVWSLIEASGVAMATIGLIGRDLPVDRVGRTPRVSLAPALSSQLRGVALNMSW